TLSRVYALGGRRDDAVRENKKIRLSGPDAMFFFGEDIAENYMIAGETDAALDFIAEALSEPSTMTVPYVKLNPVWDPLRSNPRFQKIIEEHQSDGKSD